MRASESRPLRLSKPGFLIGSLLTVSVFMTCVSSAGAKLKLTLETGTWAGQSLSKSKVSLGIGASMKSVLATDSVTIDTLNNFVATLRSNDSYSFSVDSAECTVHCRDLSECYWFVGLISGEKIDMKGTAADCCSHDFTHELNSNLYALSGDVSFQSVQYSASKKKSKGDGSRWVHPSKWGTRQVMILIVVGMGLFGLLTLSCIVSYRRLFRDGGFQRSARRRRIRRRRKRGQTGDKPNVPLESLLRNPSDPLAADLADIMTVTPHGLEYRPVEDRPMRPPPDTHLSVASTVLPQLQAFTQSETRSKDVEVDSESYSPEYVESYDSQSAEERFILQSFSEEEEDITQPPTFRLYDGRL